ncbi:competence type IV pilus minor pilin ComGG [Bacillus changyiensis]|uniref:competence type IV pilus minor pilin ComGG n=1 Tax=Bacillus changyiensis TaxID=3004103 RepID=UPI0022E91951|nr:competence type IV pilus minor pilin ComGG [Bacillus changyiensis]MDA1474858.1 competence type IV pilus minor pilin ComGG [Bacillus changyiensis]
MINLNNGNGFIYPATLFMAVICMLCASQTASSFITKQAFVKQTKQFYIQQNLLQNGVLHALRQIQTKKVKKEGIEKQVNELVTYVISPTDKQTMHVGIQVKTASKAVHTVEFHYDIKTKHITKWKEK